MAGRVVKGERTMTKEWTNISLVGEGVKVPCADGVDRPYLSFDAAASTAALPVVAERIAEFLPWYSGLCQVAGYKSQVTVAAYEEARASFLRFASRPDTDTAIICRNTTEAINHLAYRLGFESGDVVLTTVAEHYANLLPWGRVAQRRYVECGRDGVFSVDEVIAALEKQSKPRLLAITGASNVTGWLPPLEAIIEAAHERGVPVAVDAAQLAPHRPLPRTADFVTWSGHKMYAPFGTGVLIGPRTFFADGDPFLFGGEASDFVELDRVVWAEPPQREEAGTPNVMGALALAAAVGQFERIGWERIIDHEQQIGRRLREAISALPGVTVLGPPVDMPAIPIVTFTVVNVPYGLIAARMSAEFGIGVAQGTFSAYPYLIRLLGLSNEEGDRSRQDFYRGDRRTMPGAIRVSASLATTAQDVDRLAAALKRATDGSPPPIEYIQDPQTGHFQPAGSRPPWFARHQALVAGAARN